MTAGEAGALSTAQMKTLQRPERTGFRCRPGRRPARPATQTAIRPLSGHTPVPGRRLSLAGVLAQSANPRRRRRAVRHRARKRQTRPEAGFANPAYSLEGENNVSDARNDRAAAAGTQRSPNDRLRARRCLPQRAAGIGSRRHARRRPRPSDYSLQRGNDLLSPRRNRLSRMKAGQPLCVCAGAGRKRKTAWRAGRAGRYDARALGERRAGRPADTHAHGVPRRS